MIFRSLQSAMQWADDWITMKRVSRTDGTLVMWGMPDFYFTCRARLVELQASKALEVLPLALLGQYTGQVGTGQRAALLAHQRLSNSPEPGELGC